MTLHIPGKRFGKLVAKRPTTKRLRGAVVWVWDCDCGATIERPATQITRRGQRSCGCLLRERLRIYGMRTHEKAGGQKRIDRIVSMRKSGMKLREIGDKLGITRERVRQLIRDFAQGTSDAD